MTSICRVLILVKEVIKNGFEKDLLPHNHAIAANTNQTATNIYFDIDQLIDKHGKLKLKHGVDTVDRNFKPVLQILKHKYQCLIY